MDLLFIKILNLSLNACWLVLAAVVIRALFKNAPKWINCCLWGLVGLRLVLPFSLESKLSLVPKANPVSGTAITTVSATGGENNTFVKALALVWLVGVMLMGLYLILSFLKLKLSLRTATKFAHNVKQSDAVSSPFVLGIIRPVIYLPYYVSNDDAVHIIAHEKAHIKRRDHLWKPLGFALLCIYWFNPVMWFAYILLCRDIETACDEKVISSMDEDSRRAYSLTLLNFSSRQTLVTACPVAFGTNNVKGRIKGIMNYRKPKFWIIIGAAVACIVAGICFFTTPKTDKTLKVDTNAESSTESEENSSNPDAAETHVIHVVYGEGDELVLENGDYLICEEHVKVDNFDLHSLERSETTYVAKISDSDEHIAYIVNPEE